MDIPSGVVPDSMLLKSLRHCHRDMLARAAGTFNLNFSHPQTLAILCLTSLDHGLMGCLHSVATIVMRYLCVIIFFAAWLAAGCLDLPAVAAAVRADAVAAIVNDTIITAREVELQSDQSIVALRRLAQRQGMDEQSYEKKYDAIMQEGLQQLIEKELILSDYKTGNLRLPERVIDDEIESSIKRQFGDRMRLMQSLRAEGMTFETWRQQRYDRIIVDVMTRHNVSRAILISPQKIEQYYTTNQVRFQMEDQVKLRMIVINTSVDTPVAQTLSLVQEIGALLDKKASFSEVASIYSEGSTRREGGDWGWVDNKKNARGLSDIAFSLRIGQHSPVIGFANDAKDESYWVYQYDKSGKIVLARKYKQQGDKVEEKKFDAGSTDTPTLQPNTFYLMLVEDKRAARTRSITEVRDEIEQELKLQEQDRLYKQWIEKLKKKAFIQTF
jgi:parvulin-like peptidyl-prolyl isomerase